MSFAPWLTQPEPKDEDPYDTNDPSLLVNVLKPDPKDPPMKDWFLDHLDVTPVEEPPR